MEKLNEKTADSFRPWLNKIPSNPCTAITETPLTFSSSLYRGRQLWHQDPGTLGQPLGHLCTRAEHNCNASAHTPAALGIAPWDARLGGPRGEGVREQLG